MPDAACSAALARPFCAQTLACLALPRRPCPQYKPETFEQLAHEQTVDKLVRFFGYPEAALRQLTFDHRYMVRCSRGALRGCLKRGALERVPKRVHRRAVPCC